MGQKCRPMCIGSTIPPSSRSCYCSSVVAVTHGNQCARGIAWSWGTRRGRVGLFASEGSPPDGPLDNIACLLQGIHLRLVCQPRLENRVLRRQVIGVTQHQLGCMRSSIHILISLTGALGEIVPRRSISSRAG